MKKKIFIQFLLALSVFLIFFSIYLIYFKDISEIETPTLTKENENQENILVNITYESIDSSGRKYIIKAESGMLDGEKPDLINMINVKAKIILLDNSIIYISSLKAEYNTVNFDTKFQKDIKLNFLENDIFCDNLNIFFKDNLLEAYNDLIYKNLDIILRADKIEIDLLTKNSKIFNFDENKVEIKKNPNGNN
tara:strand:- start:4799 stop:5377 length:579 start_codon:yes stop_codon:yes gene_type:complete